MFCEIVVGWPGRYLLKNLANSRADRSVLAPAVVGMIMVTVLPLKDTGSSASAGAASVRHVAATAIVSGNLIWTSRLCCHLSVWLTRSLVPDRFRGQRSAGGKKGGGPMDRRLLRLLPDAHARRRRNQVAQPRPKTVSDCGGRQKSEIARGTAKL
jgi:hypothetical protein